MGFEYERGEGNDGDGDDGNEGGDGVTGPLGTDIGLLSGREGGTGIRLFSGREGGAGATSVPDTTVWLSGPEVGPYCGTGMVACVSIAVASACSSALVISLTVPNRRLGSASSARNSIESNPIGKGIGASVDGGMGRSVNIRTTSV